MTVRAKYVCTEIVKRASWNKTPGASPYLYTARLNAVTSGSEENKKFFEYTPVGNLEIGQYKEDVFEVGAEYYIDFTKA